MEKSYALQLEEAALELLKELAPLELSDDIETDIWAADVNRLRKLREMASEFSQACARRAAELIELEVRSK